MTISDDRARELASLLSDDLACTDSRTRLLCLAELMSTLTDEDHRLANSDIRAILRARFGDACVPAENTINSDLRILREHGFLGWKVHTTPSGSWCQNTRLPVGKVRLLLNAVQASRFLTAQQSGQLQGDLGALVSCNQEDDLLGEVFVEQRTRTGAEQVFENNDLIARAIREGRKIEFNYAFNGFDGKPCFLEGADGSCLRVETPIGLVYAHSNYYLESYSQQPWRHGTHLMHSRVDRMYNVRVSEEKADKGKDVSAARRSLRRRVSESVEMVDGPVRTIFLRVRADYTNVMFDMFGFGLKFGQFNGAVGQVDTTAVTCVRVAQSFTFFRWLASAGDGVVLERPKSEMWLASGPWPAQVKETPIKQLRDDYKRMREGYLDFLDRARSAYE